MAEGKSGWWAQMRSGEARSWTTSTSAWKYKLADCCPPDSPSLRSGQLLAATSTHASECSGGTCHGPRCARAPRLPGEPGPAPIPSDDKPAPRPTYVPWRELPDAAATGHAAEGCLR